MRAGIAVGSGLALSMLLVGCDEVPNGDDNGAAEDGEATEVAADGEFEAADSEGVGLTYDEEAIPEGSEFDVAADLDDEGLEVELDVSGLEADREFGAHLHTDACEEDPEASGPHYQDDVEPDLDEDEVSVDPDYANPDNEVWLDFTTDEDGDAEASTTVDWQPRDGEANSVVIHEEHTATEEGEAGTAGDRLACVTIAL